MSNESVEVMLARMDERLAMVLEEQKASKEARKEQYQEQEKFRLAVAQFGDRLAALEKKFNEAQPTLTEFVATKNKVIGAGKMGHWLWLAGAFLIGAVFKGREILHWFSGGTPSAH